MQILIVGGYGHVGLKIARLIHSRSQAGVCLAGRSLERAQAQARALGGEGRRLDLRDPQSWGPALEGVALVAVCMDQQDDAFARFVLSHGKHYLDISADYAFLRQVEALEDTARTSGARALLSVGMAPGLTNLMVRSCCERLETPLEARIGIRLGLGDEHGPAALEWALREAIGDGRRRAPVKMAFGHLQKQLTAYPYDFADQHVVPRTLGLRSARTVMTFDSPLMTRLLMAVAPLLKDRAGMQAALVKILSRVHLGDDCADITVEVDGLREGHPQTVRASMESRREADLTALVAALAIECLLREDVAPGVHHLEQVVEPARVYAALEQYGARFSWPQPAHAPVPEQALLQH